MPSVDLSVNGAAALLGGIGSELLVLVVLGTLAAVLRFRLLRR